MLRKSIYPQIEGQLNQWADFLASKNITPNQLTLAGAAATFLAGWIYASGNLFFGSLVAGFASFGDMLDGALARRQGKASRFGAFLDSTVDRYADFFLFGGLALYFAERGHAGWFLIVMAILLGSFVTSYTKARAEGLNIPCEVGAFERAERIIILILGTLITPLLPLCLWILLIGTHATAIQRILHVKKALSSDQKS